MLLTLVSKEREGSYILVELNKIYIVSAPKAVEAMANDPDHFTISTSTDQTYVEMGTIHSAEMKEVTVTSVSKVFKYRSNLLQAVIYITRLPIAMGKKRLDTTVKQYAQNIAQQQSNRGKIARES